MENYKLTSYIEPCMAFLLNTSPLILNVAIDNSNKSHVAISCKNISKSLTYILAYIGKASSYVGASPAAS